MMRVISAGAKRERIEFDSITDLRDTVAHNFRNAEILKYLDGRRDEDYTGDVSTWQELTERGKFGWKENVEELLKISEDTLNTIDREFDLPSWQSYYDVTGSDVDVDRFLSGMPENMISYVMIDTPKVGRVATLSMNLAASGMVSAETITARGKYLVALVYALEAIGIRTEVYADFQAHGIGYSDWECQVLTKIKDADETMDPAMIMFALAHPAFMRMYILSAMHGMSATFRSKLGVGHGYGIPTKGFDNTGVLPDNTLEVECSMRGAWTDEKAKTFVVENLKELGIIA